MLVAQLIARPGASASTLLDEYYTRFFGEAGRTMRQFFERCEDPGWPNTACGLVKHFRSETQAGLFPRGMRQVAHVARAGAAWRIERK